MIKWSQTSLRTQIAVLLTITTAAALLVTTATIFVNEYRRYHAQVSERLTTEAQIIAANSEAALVFDDEPAAKETLATLRAAPHVLRAKLLRAGGSTIARYVRVQDKPAAAPATARPAPAPQAAAADDATPLLTRRLDIFHDGTLVGVLHVEADRAVLYAAFYRRAGVTAVILALAVAALLLVARRLADTVVKPVSRLIAVSKRIASENEYSLRADTTGTGEVAELMRVFNEMLREIQKRDGDLVAARNEIERASQEVAAASRRAGMAEVAVGVLHNMGNALNGVTVSTSLMSDWLREFRYPQVEKAIERLARLPAEVAADASATSAKLCAYLSAATANHRALVAKIVDEAQSLSTKISDIRGLMSQHETVAVRGSTLAGEVVVHEVIDGAIEAAGDALGGRGIEVQRDYGPECRMSLDRHKVTQVLIVLLANAADAVAASGRREGGIIAVSFRRGADGRAIILVRDNGVGIGSGDLTRVFQQGFTTKPGPQRRPTSGLGLHTAANLAREMRGDLRAESNGPGGGATFSLVLPGLPPPPAAQATTGRARVTATSIAVLG